MAPLEVAWPILLRPRSSPQFKLDSDVDNPSPLLAPHRLTKEHTEAKKKMDDPSVESDKKTFLKAQIPKMESEIKDVKEKLINILDADELDPRGEYYLLAEKLTK